MKKYILLSLLFFCNASIMMGQEKQLTISGHVFDESNESLPGVSVYLKDRAGVGTSTDINGAFKLSAQKRRYHYILFYRLQKDGTYRFER